MLRNSNLIAAVSTWLSLLKLCIHETLLDNPVMSRRNDVSANILKQIKIMADD